MQPELSAANSLEPRESVSEERQGHVLLVDDGETNRMIAAAMLRRAGYAVDQAHDGAEAVAMAYQRRYVVILMDLAMPVMDGMEATTSIRDLPEPFASTPIIALTAHDTPSDRIRCLEAGMDDYIAKPLRYAELVDVVHRTLEEKERERKGRAAVSAVRPALLLAENLSPADLLDDRKLEQLEHDAGQGAIEDLIAMFLKEANSLAKGLQDIDEKRDIAELERLAHSLKSSSAAFGARALEVVGASAEKAFSKPDLAAAKAILKNLDTLVSETEAAFNERWPV